MFLPITNNHCPFHFISNEGHATTLTNNLCFCHCSVLEPSTENLFNKEFHRFDNSKRNLPFLFCSSSIYSANFRSLHMYTRFMGQAILYNNKCNAQHQRAESQCLMFWVKIYRAWKLRGSFLFSFSFFFLFMLKWKNNTCDLVFSVPDSILIFLWTKYYDFFFSFHSHSDLLLLANVGMIMRLWRVYVYAFPYHNLYIIVTLIDQPSNIIPYQMCPICVIFHLLFLSQMRAISLMKYRLSNIPPIPRIRWKNPENLKFVCVSENLPLRQCQNFLIVWHNFNSHHSRTSFHSFLWYHFFAFLFCFVIFVPSSSSSFVF